MRNQRHFSRIQFDVHTHIIVHEKTYKTELLDISLKGALLAFEEEAPLLKVGDTCTLNIHLPSSSINLVFEAKLVHLHEETYGIKFIREEIETFTHLRRLIELNLGDGDQVTNELHFLLEE